VEGWEVWGWGGVGLFLGADFLGAFFFFFGCSEIEGRRGGRIFSGGGEGFFFWDFFRKFVRRVRCFSDLRGQVLAGFFV